MLFVMMLWIVTLFQEFVTLPPEYVCVNRLSWAAVPDAEFPCISAAAPESSCAIQGKWFIQSLKGRVFK